RDKARETAETADADNVLTIACGGFCRPLRATDHAAAARRLSGAGGSLRVYGVCARCGARLPGTLAAQFVPVRAGSGHHILFSGAAGRGGQPDSERAAKTEILRSGNGFGVVVRSRGELSTVSGANPRGVRQDGGHG